MRKHHLWLCFILLFAAPELSAQTSLPKVCVSQDGEGYDALRLARELSSRKLESGTPLAVVAMTRKVLSSQEEQELADRTSLFVRVLLKEQTAKARSDEIERLACDYNIQVWHHESAASLDVNGTADNPSTAPGVAGGPSTSDPETVSYELRKAGSKKVLAQGLAPPRTVFVRQGHRVFNPYPLFADQIVKKLNSVR
jgi:hypothetical protein